MQKNMAVLWVFILLNINKIVWSGGQKLFLFPKLQGLSAFFIWEKEQYMESI